MKYSANRLDLSKVTTSQGDLQCCQTTGSAVPPAPVETTPTNNAMTRIKWRMPSSDIKKHKKLFSIYFRAHSFVETDSVVKVTLYPRSD